MTHEHALIEVRAAHERYVASRLTMAAALREIGCPLHVEMVLSLAKVVQGGELIQRDVGYYHARVLEAEGLVTIDREAADRDGRRVTATDAGRELVGRLGG